MAYLIPQPTKFSSVPDYDSPAMVSGYGLKVFSATQLTLTAGSARAFGQDYYISYAPNQPGLTEEIGIDVSTVGANGAYPVAVPDLVLADNTVLGVYVIGKSSGTTNGSLDNSVNVSAVVATGDNFLPPGYDVFRRVGLVYVDASNNELLPWIQTGLANERKYWLEDGVELVSAGNATTDTNLNLSVNEGIILPGKSTQIDLSISFTAGAAGQYVTVAPFGLSASLDVPVTLFSPSTNVISWNVSMVCGLLSASPRNAAIKYKVSNSGASTNIYLVGFTDVLNNDLF